MSRHKVSDNRPGANGSGLALGSLLLCLATAPLQADFDLAAELYQQSNYVEAHQAFTLEAARGDPRAQTVLALMFKYGEGTPQDLALAFKWYERAAEQNYPPGLYHAGTMLAYGMGTEPDRARAIRYLSAAADLGFERARGKLAEMNGNAALEKAPLDNAAWSQDWDFTLPIQYRLLTPDQPTGSIGTVYLAQVGAMATEPAVNRLWQQLNEHHPDLFGNLTAEIRLLEQETGKVFRLYAGPLADTGDAADFCARLLERAFQAGCLPVERKAGP